jgi:hypothetical protein
MVIDPEAAGQFISGYKNLLSEVHRLSGGKPGMELLNMLASAREAVVKEPSLIETAASNLDSAGHALPPDVLEAIRSLRLQRWVYLRDTTKYSIFMDMEGKDAYAVLGLTQRLRDIVGGTGIVLMTGIFHFHGAFVCDGIVSNVIWLGSNYRREYAATFASLKKSGHFHVG